ncbi:hypothetical protein ABH926_004238 [Catenulispora sp. GP43]|uniref:hypothetical protein n=1 Tax=Catenulispora sp. GP43 TaxID=3156263 RepID=UPI0035180F66
MTEAYDGAALARALESADPRGARLFTATVSEALVTWLRPAVALPVVLQTTQDLAARSTEFLWDSVGPGGDPDAGADLHTEIEAALEEFPDEIGLFEDALSGLYYAIQFASEGGVGHAALVAEKLYEAADHTALDRSASVPGILQDSDAIRSLPEVQHALRLLRRALEVAGGVTPDAGDADIAGFVQAARAVVNEAGEL